MEVASKSNITSTRNNVENDEKKTQGKGERKEKWVDRVREEERNRHKGRDDEKVVDGGEEKGKDVTSRVLIGAKDGKSLNTNSNHNDEEETRYYDPHTGIVTSFIETR